MRVSKLWHEEDVRVDVFRLEEICMDVGIGNSSAVICGAMEDLATLLSDAEAAWRRSDLARVQPIAAQIAGVADRVGLSKLSRVAMDVHGLCKSYDDAGLGATMARLSRVGEASLFAIWEVQDVSV
jgi:hypothetical protein